MRRGALGDGGVNDPAVGERMLMTWPTGESSGVSVDLHISAFGGRWFQAYQRLDDLG